MNETVDLRAMYQIDSTYRCKNRITKSCIRMQCVKFEVAKRISFGYYVTCDTHNQTHTLINKRTEALLVVRKPWTFCDGCAEIHFNTVWQPEPSNSDVSVTQDVLINSETSQKTEK